MRSNGQVAFFVEKLILCSPNRRCSTRLAPFEYRRALLEERTGGLSRVARSAGRDVTLRLPVEHSGETQVECVIEVRLDGSQCEWCESRDPLGPCTDERNEFLVGEDGGDQTDPQSLFSAELLCQEVQLTRPGRPDDPLQGPRATEVPRQSPGQEGGVQHS